MGNGYGPVPYWQYLGMELTRFSNGEAEMYVDVQKHHTQSAGNVHGGVMASLVDSCIAAAFRSIADEDERCSTIDLAMRFIRPISSGRMVCRARIVHSGKRIFFAEASVFDSDEQLAALAQATFRRWRAPS